MAQPSKEQLEQEYTRLQQQIDQLQVRAVEIQGVLKYLNMAEEKKDGDNTSINN